ncbi:MAG TPA: DUF3352 domain-containing protein [Blastocatellia bacterium]|nr:DUF3352 domain-containing protein [Blastocatellia bacterium]
MAFRAYLTRRNISIASVAVFVVLVFGAYYALRRPPRVPMERYVPTSALAFIEIDSLADLVDGLTDTKAWRELAPVLGLSSQLRQIGRAADLMGRTGLGPAEAVIAGGAQYAVALTGLEAETGAAADGPYIHFKPRFAAIVETHASSETAARLVRERAAILAQRIYGEAASEQTEEYHGAQLRVFQGPQPDRQMVAAAAGSVILIANHTAAIKACLDAIGGRTATLAEDATLKQSRPVVGHNAAVFAYMTEAGIRKLAEFGPALFATRFTTDPDRISAIAGLFGHLSNQTMAGMLYSSSFDSGGVTEKYLTLLRPPVAEALVEPFKPAASADFGSLQLIPRGVEDITILNIERAGDMPELLLKQLTPRVDVVAGLALREFVLSLREQLGLEPEETLGNAIGDEVTLVKFSDAEPVAMLAQVKDRTPVLPVLARYMKQGGETVSTEQYKNTEIIISAKEPSRAASFIGDYLALGTRDQIARMIDAQAGGNAIAKDERFTQALAKRPAGSSIISCRPEGREAGEMMLAIAELTRVSDGSRELLEQDAVRSALDRLPPAVSFTEFRDIGIYTETRSAVGNFSLVGSLVGGDEEEE